MAEQADWERAYEQDRAGIEQDVIPVVMAVIDQVHKALFAEQPGDVDRHHLAGAFKSVYRRGYERALGKMAGEIAEIRARVESVEATTRFLKRLQDEKGGMHDASDDH